MSASVIIPKMKLLLAGVALLVAVSPLRAAPDLAMGSGEGAPGETVTLSLLFTNVPNTAALQFEINYNPQLVTPQTPGPGAALPNHRVASSVVSPGVMRVIVYSPQNSSVNSGILLSLPFQIAQGASSPQTAITLNRVIISSSTASRLTATSASPGAISVRGQRAVQFTAVRRLANGVVEVTLTSTPAADYIIQGSGDLLQWMNLSTNRIEAGTVVQDPAAATLPRRFYRARSTP